MSEDDTMNTEVIEVPSEASQELSVAPVKVRTEKQQEALAKARSARAQKAELARKQSELDKRLLEKARKTEADRIEREYNAMDDDDEPETPPKRKRKPARKIVVTEVSSASESDEEIVVQIPKKREPSAEQLREQRLYQKMFTLD